MFLVFFYCFWFFFIILNFAIFICLYFIVRFVLYSSVPKNVLHYFAFHSFEKPTIQNSIHAFFCPFIFFFLFIYSVWFSDLFGIIFFFTSFLLCSFSFFICFFYFSFFDYFYLFVFFFLFFSISYFFLFIIFLLSVPFYFSFLFFSHFSHFSSLSTLFFTYKVTLFFLFFSLSFFLLYISIYLLSLFHSLSFSFHFFLFSLTKSLSFFFFSFVSSFTHLSQFLMFTMTFATLLPENQATPDLLSHLRDTTTKIQLRIQIKSADVYWYQTK